MEKSDIWKHIAHSPQGSRVQVNVSLTKEQHDILTKIATEDGLGPRGIPHLIRFAVGELIYQLRKKRT